MVKVEFWVELLLVDAELIQKIYLFSRLTGPSLSPFNAWVLSKSLETLAIRVEIDIVKMP